MDPAQQQPPPQMAPAAYPQYQRAPAPPVSKAWRTTKAVFNVLAILFAAVALALSIALAVDPSIGSWIFVWTVPQVAVSLLWCAAELITCCARKGKAGIHPGAHVALHLLLWMGVAAGLAFNGWYYAYQFRYYYYYDYYYDYDYYNSTAFETMVLAIMALMALLIFIHFFLFVRACVETAHRNRAARQSAMVFMPTPQQPYYPHPQQQPVMMGGSPPPPPPQMMSMPPPPPQSAHMSYVGSDRTASGMYDYQHQQPQQYQQYQQGQQVPGFGGSSIAKGVDSHATGSSTTNNNNNNTGQYYPTAGSPPPPQQQLQQEDGLHPVGGGQPHF